MELYIEAVEGQVDTLIWRLPPRYFVLIARYSRQCDHIRVVVIIGATQSCNQ
jgi:hypothetical protein